MADMLVKLYELPPIQSYLDRVTDNRCEVRKPIGPEKHVILDWIAQNFSLAWASEADMAFSNRPVTLFLAVRKRELLGFACYDATALGYFGPTGVAKSARGQGLGTALLMASLHDMRTKGYAYAIIGGAGPKDFYEKVVGAVEISGSSPGIYRDYLR